MLKRQQEIMKEAEERRIVRERDHLLLEQRIHEEQNNQNLALNVVDSKILENVRAEDLLQTKIETTNTDIPKQNTDIPNLIPEPDITTVKEIKTSPVAQNDKRRDSATNKGSAKPLSRSSSLKTPSTMRKFSQNQSSTKNSQTSKYNLAASSLALFDESSNEVASYPNPNEALKKALKLLSTDTWMGKIEGIRTVQRLAKNHPDILLSQLHAVVLALLTEVKNLRSSVARAAILATGDLFLFLKKNMEPDLDLIASTLLSKCGETVGFIREDIEKVMNHLIDVITPSKAALAIIAGGAR
ncbi:Protein FAM179B, partial [Stegodyphus mimosarum]